MNIMTLKDDLTGNWWHYIRSKDFGFLEKVPDLTDVEASEGDILIHKQIKKGERFPTIRYHLITENGSNVIENKVVKELLAARLVAFVKEEKELPFACDVAKYFKNGNVQVDYKPTSHDSFALKIVPKEHGMEDAEGFFEGLDAQDNPLHASKESAGKPSRSKQEWQLSSSSDPNKTYTVRKNADGTFSCTCPHHTFRKAECKHIKEIKKTL